MGHTHSHLHIHKYEVKGNSLLDEVEITLFEKFNINNISIQREFKKEGQNIL